MQRYACKNDEMRPAQMPAKGTAPAKTAIKAKAK